jgi:predicted O-methyltransferase YrrM
MTIDERLAAITHRMEQHRAEIVPFATWLLAQRPHHVVEIGVRWGGTSALWHELATGTVVGVDRPGPDSLAARDAAEVVRTLVERYPRFRYVEGDSHVEPTRETVLAALNHEPIDFLFLDGDHSYEGVTKDWAMYSPLVRPGGVVAFHDIVDSPLIRQAGHGVYRFWRELTGDKREWSVRAAWGGIGAVKA